MENEKKWKKRLPCLHPTLPLEVETMIYSYLSVADLSNLSGTFDRSQDILKNDKYSNQVARMKIARETTRLHKSLQHLNFTCLSLATAFRRYIQTFGLRRDEKFAPKTLAFRRAYFQANPGVCERLSDLQLVIGVAQMISDWLQHDLYDTFCTPLAKCVDEIPSLEAALRTACLESWRPKTKGACQLLVTVFQREISSCWSDDFINQLFREIRAKPLEDLRISYPMPLGWPGEEDDSDSDLEDDMGICPKKAKELPGFLRVKLDLPTTYFGFAVHVGTITENGRRLIRQIDDNGDYCGLLFADLVKELDVRWK